MMCSPLNMPRTLRVRLWKYGGGEEAVEDISEENGGKVPYVGCGSGYELHLSE